MGTMKDTEGRRLEDLASRVGQALVRGPGDQPDLNTLTGLSQDLERARRAAVEADESHPYSAGALDSLAWVLEGARGEIRDETPSLRETLKAVFDMIMQWG